MHHITKLCIKGIFLLFFFYFRSPVESFAKLKFGDENILESKHEAKQEPREKRRTEMPKTRLLVGDGLFNV